jgi:hypothetical protein
MEAKDRMEFFLDVDGVILDLETALVDFLRRHYLPDLPADYQPRNWALTEEFGKLNIREAWDGFVGSEFFSSMPPLVSTETFNRLSSSYPVYLITNLTEAQRRSRLDNLRLHSLAFRELHMAGFFTFGLTNYPTKAEAIRRLRRADAKVIFLDDHPKNCRDILENVVDAEAYLMTRPHNQDLADEGWTRVTDWDDFLSRVRVG